MHTHTYMVNNKVESIGQKDKFFIIIRKSCTVEKRESMICITKREIPCTYFLGKCLSRA